MGAQGPYGGLEACLVPVGHGLMGSRTAQPHQNNSSMYLFDRP